MIEPPTETVRRRMVSQRRKDTAAEVQLRRALYRDGWRYRVSYPVPGMPRRTIDVAFPSRKVAVFVDGCFWHGCPDHGVAPKHNGTWWRDKLAANRARDRDTTNHLESLGWTVVRVWEHEVSTDGIERVERVLSVMSVP